MASISLGKIGPEETHSPASDAACPNAITSASWKQTIDNAFAQEWRALAEVAAEPNPFYEHWGLAAALKACDPDGSVELVQFRENGVLCGLLPVRRSNSYYGYPIPHLAGWLNDNAFCGAPLVARGSEASFWSALIGWASAASKTSLFLHLEHLPEDSTLFASLHAAIEAHYPAAIVHRQDRAMLRSDQASEDYFTGSMSGKKRKELRRQFNRLSELGNVTFERLTGTEKITAWTDLFLALEAAGWKGKEGSALASNKDTEQMFRESLLGAAKAGRLERLSLLLDGRPIAMLVNFITPPGAFSFKTTFDEDLARFSPGVLLQRENLELLDNPTIDWADSCAAADHPMIERIWREKRSIVSVNIGLGGTLRRTMFKQLVRAEGSAERMVSTGTDTADSDAVFAPAARDHFAANYPETPHILDHQMSQHTALTLDALADLAGDLPASSIEFNSGDLPIGVNGKPDATGLTIQDTIRHIATSNSWAVLKNIEQAPAYNALLLSLLSELKPQIEAKTGAMLRPQGFIFISSPNAMTPYHFDPEHNILLQLKGSKVMTQFPAGNHRFAPDPVHEGYHSGGARELTWQDQFAADGTELAIEAGQALFVPVMAPHFVRNGPSSSISLSITWRSDWSFEEADARGLNRLIRKSGLTPTAPSRWPGSNKPKAYAYRALRKFGVVG